MAVIDKFFHATLREIETEYGSLRKVPETDERLMYLRKVYWGQKRTPHIKNSEIAGVTYKNGIKFYPPHELDYQYKIDEQLIKSRLKEHGLSVNSVDALAGVKRGSLANALSSTGSLSEETRRGLQANMPYIFKDDVFMSKYYHTHTIYYFDKEQVRKATAEKGMTRRAVAQALLPLKVYHVMLRGRGPKHIIQTLYDYLGLDWEEEFPEWIECHQTHED